MKQRIPNFDVFLNESSQTIFYPVYHGGKLDFSKPIYFNDKKIIAQSYGEVAHEYKVVLRKIVTIDFSSADGWWLPADSAKKQARQMKMALNDFDKYKDYKEIKSVKTDHFVRAALDKGYDGIIFKNIMDAGSLPIKSNKYIRSTDIVVLKPSSSNVIKIN